MLRWLIQLLDLTKSLWIWDAPYCDDSVMMQCQLRIGNHEHDIAWWELGYVCEDFDRDGYCWQGTRLAIDVPILELTEEFGA